MERLLSALPTDTSRSPDGAYAWPRCLVAQLREWRRRQVSRRQLAQLDARQLADVGISEAQRQAELDKPFWR